MDNARREREWSALTRVFSTWLQQNIRQLEFSFPILVPSKSPEVEHAQQNLRLRYDDRTKMAVYSMSLTVLFLFDDWVRMAEC